MTDWDGRGLPPVAGARIERARASGVRTSLLPVAGQIGLDVCGLEPVGEVMGCLVEHIGWQGYGGCGIGYGAGYGVGVGYGYANYAPGTITGRSSGYFGFGPYLDALKAGWNGALGRMLTECVGLGADGVIGVRLDENHLEEGAREFVALGTAVRSTGRSHPSRPFSTTLPGQDVAKLLLNGWVPTAAIVALSVGIRHDDYQTRLATMAYASNIEVPGYTDLVQTVRADVRRDLAEQAAASGADSAILTAPMRLAVHEIEVSEGHRDHVGIAQAIGTGIAHFGRRTPPVHPRTVMPLT